MIENLFALTIIYTENSNNNTPSLNKSTDQIIDYLVSRMIFKKLLMSFGELFA